MIYTSPKPLHRMKTDKIMETTISYQEPPPPEYVKSSSPHSEEFSPKNDQERKDFLLNLQKKYLTNLETINHLTQEKSHLNEELTLTKKYLKHERKCNHLHRILRLARETGNKELDESQEEGMRSGDGTKEEVVASQVVRPPKYDENIHQSSSLKANGTSPLPFPIQRRNLIRPQSADSGLRRKSKQNDCTSANGTSPERLELEELEYQRDLAEYETKRMKEEQNHEKLLKSLRRSYEENPCLDWQRERQLKEERRRKSQERQRDHYRKWKLMNQQFTEFNEPQGPPLPPGSHAPAPTHTLSGDPHPGKSVALDNVWLPFLVSVP